LLQMCIVRSVHIWCLFVFSWGKSWGSSGYIYMGKNNANDCGIKSFASYASV